MPFYERLTTGQALIGASLFRFLVGLNILLTYSLNYLQRHYLWGPNSPWINSGESFSLYGFSNSPLFFEILFHLGILVAILFTIGYRTRLISVINFVFLWSLHARNPWLLNGGDNLIRISLFYLLFANTGTYLALDSKRYSQCAMQNPNSLLQHLSAILHNFAVLAIIVQLCVMYFITGLYKVMGEVWQNGTAIYYIFRVHAYTWPGVNEWIYQNSYLTVLLTYLTIFFEISFPFLLFNRVTRYLALFTGLIFHLGIALFMALPRFQWYVLSHYTMLIADREYQTLAERFKIWRVRNTWSFRRLAERIMSIPFLSRLQLLVFYDGQCPMCIQSMKLLKHLDLFSLINCVSFRDPRIISAYGLDVQRLERRMHSRPVGSSNYREGIDAVIQVVTRLVPLWPILPVLIVARLTGLGQRVYDFMARHRTILPVSACKDSYCPKKDTE